MERETGILPRRLSSKMGKWMLSKSEILVNNGTLCPVEDKNQKKLLKKQFAVKYCKN